MGYQCTNVATPQPKKKKKDGWRKSKKKTRCEVRKKWETIILWLQTRALESTYIKDCKIVSMRSDLHATFDVKAFSILSARCSTNILCLTNVDLQGLLRNIRCNSDVETSKTSCITLTNCGKIPSRHRGLYLPTGAKACSKRRGLAKLLTTERKMDVTNFKTRNASTITPSFFQKENQRKGIFCIVQLAISVAQLARERQVHWYR